MIYRVDWNNAKAVIEFGVIRTLLGLVIISPVVGRLIDALGGLHFGLNLVVALGSAHGHWEPAGGINWPCLICGDAPRVEVPPKEPPSERP